MLQVEAKKIIKEVLFPDYKKYGYGRLAAILLRHPIPKAIVEEWEKVK